MAGAQAVDLDRVELGEGLVPGVRQVDDDDAIGLVGPLEEGETVLGEDTDPRPAEGVVVEAREAQVAPGQVRHRRVQIDHVDPLHGAVAQHLPHREPVAAADDEHPLPVAGQGHGRMDEGLVISVLVDGGELQVAVQVEADVVAPLGEDDLLVRRALAVDDPVGVEIALQPLAEGVGRRQGQAQSAGDDESQGQEPAPARLARAWTRTRPAARGRRRR